MSDVIVKDTPLSASTAGMVYLPGGVFRMGSDRHYPEEAPVHSVAVDGFFIDETPVTNRQFRAFVEATGHVTFAEIPPDPKDYPGALPHMLRAGSLMFNPPAGPVDLRDWSQWWTFKFGANWKKPYGEGSSIKGLDDHPVVHVAFCDAEAYAHWAGKALPTEAEFEFAARGGLDGAEFAWGDELTPGGKHMANTWQGDFPRENTKADGFARTSPVKTYPPNGYGLYDMIGNVWEWTTDFWSNSPSRRRAQGLLRARQSARRPGGGKLRRLPAANPHPAQGAQRRLASLRAELLPPLSPGGPARRAGRHVHEPRRLSLRSARKSPRLTPSRSPATSPAARPAAHACSGNDHARIDVGRDSLLNAPTLSAREALSRRAGGEAGGFRITDRLTRPPGAADPEAPWPERQRHDRSAIEE